MKFKRIFPLLLTTLALTACGSTENIKPEEAVEKTIPALMYNTVQAAGEEGSMTLNAKINSLNIEVDAGDVKVTVPISGEVALGVRNAYTTDVNQFQAGVQLKNFNLGATIAPTGEASKTYSLNNFSVGAYVNAGKLYVDLSNQTFLDGLIDAVVDYIGMDGLKTIIKNFIGDGKYYVPDLIPADKFPIAKKSEITEEEIASKVKEVFGIIESEDLSAIMNLTHDKSNDTYDLKFDVKDPAIVNRSYKNSEAGPKLKCETVDLSFEATTNNKGVFENSKVKGSLKVANEPAEGEQKVSVNIAVDAECGFDVSHYTIQNPSFSDFKDGSAIVQTIISLLGGVMGNGGSLLPF